MIRNSTPRIPTRVGGVTALAGGTTLVVASSLETAVGYGGDVPGSLGFVVVLGLLALSGALLATATVGAASYLGDRGGPRAVLGLAVAGAANVLLAIGSVAALVTGEAATWTTLFGHVRLAGVIVAVLGVTALSVVMWRNATVRIAAVTWVWTFPLVVLFVGIGAGVHNTLGVNLLWTFLGVQLGAGWLLLGYRLLYDTESMQGRHALT